MWRERLRTNINPGFMPPLQCEPGCKRMTGTTSWGRFLRRARMSKKVKVMLLLSLLLIAAPTLFGQTQAKAVAAAAEGMARNPAASAAIRFALLLGLVLIESLALYVMVIIFAKVG